MEKLLELLGITGTGMAFSFAVLALFWKGDEALSDEFRQQISKRLLGITTPQQTSVNWATVIVKVFDRLFRFDRIPSIERSIIATLIAILILFPLISEISWREFIVLMQLMEDDLGFPAYIDFIPIFMINFFADYISLIESRFIIKLLEKQSNMISYILLLFADILLTAVIWIICFVVKFIWQWETFTVDFIFGIVESTLTTRLWNPFIYALFFSTFVTSFWIWIYLATLALFKLSLVSTRAISFLKWALPIQKKPIRSIGQVAFLIIFIPFFAIEALRIIF